MANIVHSNSSGKKRLKLNVFCRPTEPESKDGIWIQSPESVSMLAFKTSKYFAQVGRFMGATGYKSIIMNQGHTSSNYYRVFCWRPLIGNNCVMFSGAELYANSRDTVGLYTTLTFYDINKHTFSKKNIFSESSGTSTSHESCGFNVFEYNDHFYAYCNFQSLTSSDSLRTRSSLVIKYDKNGNEIERSTDYSNAIPFNYFIIGTVRQEVYALSGARIWSIPSDYKSTTLYKVALNGFTPQFSQVATIPEVNVSQRCIAISGNCLYFARATELLEYNTITKTIKTFPYPTPYTSEPQICVAGNQILITIMSLIEKRTFLFNIESKSFQQLAHDDPHQYSFCSMYANLDQVLIFPGAYYSEESSNADDMNITAFDLTKTVLENKTVAIEDSPTYDAILCSDPEDDVYLRGFFGNVWLYNQNEYQEYPTYIGDGESWRRVKN